MATSNPQRIYMWLSKKIKQLYAKLICKNSQPDVEVTSDDAIPLYIKLLARQYPLICTEAANQAVGKITKCNLRTKVPIGHCVTRTEFDNRAEYECIYVHIKDNYFKQIFKVWTY
jgi:hypothetical protein